MYKMTLQEIFFQQEKQVLIDSEHFKVETFLYPQNIAALRIHNSQGYVEILPFYGQMIWDAVFNGVSLKMTNMFRTPRLGKEIVDTYGCFAFHSGLLSNGCPSSEDTHPLHGEFPCAEMGKAWLEIEEDRIRLISKYEYVKGFGYHYLARPNVSLGKDESFFEIGMKVNNLSKSQPMPLMYMCHMNHAYVENGVMSQNIPDNAWQLRQTVPAHVKPTPEWTAFNEKILKGEISAQTLSNDHCFDPEIVYFADNLSQYGENLRFTLKNPATGIEFFSQFSTQEFPHATRWILNNPDQKVAAFVLPATARPEGYCASEKAGTLQWLQPKESRSFSVITGINL